MIYTATQIIYLLGDSCARPTDEKCVCLPCNVQSLDFYAWPYLFVAGRRDPGTPVQVAYACRYAKHVRILLARKPDAPRAIAFGAGDFCPTCGRVHVDLSALHSMTVANSRAIITLMRQRAHRSVRWSSDCVRPTWCDPFYNMWNV